jgi:hypothetical protein
VLKKTKANIAGKKKKPAKNQARMSLAYKAKPEAKKKKRKVKKTSLILFATLIRPHKQHKLSFSHDFFSSLFFFFFL